MTSTYRPTDAIRLLRPAVRRARITTPSPAARAFSTSSPSPAVQSSTSGNVPSPPRRQVTVTNDTGAVRWSELSVGEKAARTTQQSFNFVVILAGVTLTGAVAYFLFSDVLSPNSKTSHFNRASTRIKHSTSCTRLLGPADQLSFHGEGSWSRWARNRFIHSTTETDRWGTEHVKVRFYVEGPLNHGVVHVHLTKRPSQDEYEYMLLALDVKGHQRVYLENANGKADSQAAPKIFGARWW